MAIDGVGLKYNVFLLEDTTHSIAEDTHKVIKVK
jgi:hypothetical protein